MRKHVSEAGGRIKTLWTCLILILRKSIFENFSLPDFFVFPKMSLFKGNPILNRWFGSTSEIFILILKFSDLDPDHRFCIGFPLKSDILEKTKIFRTMMYFSDVFSTKSTFAKGNPIQNRWSGSDIWKIQHGFPL